MDPYEVLGLHAGASIAEIEEAYKDLRARYAPENYEGSAAAGFAAQKRQAIEQAYSTLINGETDFTQVHPTKSQQGGYYGSRQGSGPRQGPYYGYNQDMQRASRGCFACTPSFCDCCSSLLIADCCCECMGGDLIPCC